MTEEKQRTILRAINDLRRDLDLPPHTYEDALDEDIVLIIDLVRRLRRDAVELRRYD